MADPRDRDSDGPRGQVGFATALSLVVGGMIGSGVFMLPASLAPYRGVSLIGWVVSAGGSVLLALVFARLARTNPATGGPYAYTRSAFGDFAGFLVGWGYWISCWTTNGALAVAFVGYLDPFAPSVVRNPALAGLSAVAAVWLLTYDYGAKKYQVVANGYTGVIAGQRPYSAWKIFFLVVAILIVVLVLAYASQS